MGLIQKLVGQTAIYGMTTIVGRFLNFLLVPLYTRYFNQAEYGVVTELYSYTVFLMILLTYGLETGFFRFSQNADDKPSVFSTILTSLGTSSTLFLLLVAVLLTPISGAIGYAGHENYILMMAVIIAIDAFTSVPFAKLRLEDRAFTFAAVKFANIGVNIGLNILLIVVLPHIARSGNNAWLLAHFGEPKIAYIFISNVAASVITLLLLLPGMLKTKYRFDFPLLKRILVYSLPLLVAGLAGSVNEVYDRISLRYFLTIPEGANAQEYILSQVGIYGASYKLAMIIAIFNQAFRFAAEPFFFSRMHAGDARHMYARIMNYFVAFTLVLFLVITLFLDFFKHFIGSNFHEGLQIVPILLMANIFLGVVFNLSIWFKLSNRTSFGVWITGAGAIITLAINMAFVPHYGYVASAWATLACYVLMSVLSYILCQKYYGIPYRVATIAGYFTLGTAIYAAHELFHFPIVLRIIAILAFIAAVVLVEKKSLRATH
ncbi:MAG: oligosaccharide flippase family protein [Bacteroidales bacterium]|jgi:O-antigen/teichoic acid export membrane protein|nr:oligosaccharide flippase family protein [Bacteroidales bacterium]